MAVTVTTQEELDSAIAAKESTIYIESPRGVRLRVYQHDRYTRVEAWGSSSVEAWGSSSVVARESSSVEARESSNLHLHDYSTSKATKFVSVHVHSKKAKFDGGVLINTSDFDLTEPLEWAEYHGVTIKDGRLLVYKAVNSNLLSDHGFAYPIGETVQAADWDPTPFCGYGLHFGPTPRHALTYHRNRGDVRFLLCAVPVDATVGIDEPRQVAKCKAQKCEVLYEVDVKGNRIGRGETL